LRIEMFHNWAPFEPSKTYISVTGISTGGEGLKSV